jgi:hydroxyacylglutathione hydrolase
VFTGDTLFSVGCGRFFEGTAQEMHESLGKLSLLPSTTLVYCGHEYTRANVEFACFVDPDNLELKEMKEWCERVSVTVPSTIERELKVNPFLRTREFVGKYGDTQVQVMAKLREMKNGF